jgi:hypothetical protein
MTPTEVRKASLRVILGVGALAAAFTATAFLPSAAVPICGCLGFAAFVLCSRSALRIAAVDDVVFEHPPLWKAPEPPAPTQPIRRPATVRRGLTAV